MPISPDLRKLMIFCHLNREEKTLSCIFQIYKKNPISCCIWPSKYLQAILSLSATEKGVSTLNRKDATHTRNQKLWELNINRMEKSNLLPQWAIKRPPKKKSKPTYLSNYPSETLQLPLLLHDLQPCWSRAVTGHLSNKNFTFQTWNTYQQFAVFKKPRDTCSTLVISPFKK